MKKTFLSMALLLGALSLSAGVVYVAPQAAGDGSGSSWDNAMDNIQKAITTAKSDPTGTTDVWVKAGTYNLTATVVIKDSVNIYGSFAGTETSVDERAMVEGGKPWEFLNPTVLNAGDSIPCMDGNKVCNQPVEINGFVFEHGAAISATNKSTAGGGAIRLTTGHTLTRSIVRNCRSDKDGGGVRIYPNGAVRYCLIENCSQATGANGGGGINAATSSTGKLIEIEGCEFRGNTSSVRGGALAINGTSGQVLVNGCTFYNNTAMTVSLGGAAVYDNAGYITEITNCVFYNNTGKNTNTDAVTNALYIKPGKFNHNTVAYNLGGVYIANGNKNSEVCNNIVWANVVDEAGATATSIAGTTVSGLIALNNYTYNPLPTDKGWLLSLDPEVATTNVEFASNKTNGDFEPSEGTEIPEGKCLAGPHFEVVPSFYGAVPADAAEEIKTAALAELDAADFHIKRQSALLNAASDTLFVDIDRDGNNRPQGPRADVGAYELPYYMVVIPAYDTAEGFIMDEEGGDLNDTTLNVASNSVLRCYVMTADGDAPYLVQTVASTNGGLTFDGEKTDVTGLVDKETFTLDLTVSESMMLEVTWTLPEGVENAFANTLVVSSEKNGVRVSGLQQDGVVEVFDINGRNVFSAVAGSETLFINLQPGMYIVRQGAMYAKAIVK